MKPNMSDDASQNNVEPQPQPIEVETKHEEAGEDLPKATLQLSNSLPTSLSVGVVCKAIHDFQPDTTLSSQQLPLNTGDIIEIIRQPTTQGWVLAHNAETKVTGFIPESFVVITGIAARLKTQMDSIVTADGTTIDSFVAPMDISPLPTKLITDIEIPVGMDITQFEGIGTTPDQQLTTTTDDQKTNPNVSNIADNSGSIVATHQLQPTTLLTGVSGVVLRDFNADINGNRLGVIKSDTVTVIQPPTNHGWVLVLNTNTGKQGFIPETYIKISGMADGNQSKPVSNKDELTLNIDEECVAPSPEPIPNETPLQQSCDQPTITIQGDIIAGRNTALSVVDEKQESKAEPTVEFMSVGSKATVTMPYDSDDPSRLNIGRGDIVEIVQLPTDDAKDWILVRNQKNTVGYVQLSYVKPGIIELIAKNAALLHRKPDPNDPNTSTDPMLDKVFASMVRRGVDNLTRVTTDGHRWNCSNQHFCGLNEDAVNMGCVNHCSCVAITIALFILLSAVWGALAGDYTYEQSCIDTNTTNLASFGHHLYAISIAVCVALTLPLLSGLVWMCCYAESFSNQLLLFVNVIGYSSIIVGILQTAVMYPFAVHLYSEIQSIQKLADDDPMYCGNESSTNDLISVLNDVHSFIVGMFWVMAVESIFILLFWAWLEGKHTHKQVCCNSYFVEPITAPTASMVDLTIDDNTHISLNMDRAISSFLHNSVYAVHRLCCPCCKYERPPPDEPSPYF